MQVLPCLCRPPKEEFEWVDGDKPSAKIEREAELRRGEVEGPEEIDSWGGLPRAWHSLGWDPSDKESAERVANWVQRHRHGLPSVSLQPVQEVQNLWEYSRLHK